MYAKKESILLINDDNDELSTIVVALNDTGIEYNCNYARNAKQALKILEGVHPDFILFDLKSLSENYFTSFKEIKKMSNARDSSVIIYSSFITDDMRENALKNGGRGVHTEAMECKSFVGNFKNDIDARTKGNTDALQLVRRSAHLN